MRLAASALLAVAAGLAPAGEAAERPPALPGTGPPIVYTINYSGRYFRERDYLEAFKAHPPDLLHVGKAVPISHHWGPIRLYQGENQYTGGPGHTLSWENIALLSPAELAERIATIRRTLKRYHAIGIREIVPYISYHTLAGDHEKRLGFWRFYDHWDRYERWAGPRPKSDPFDWLVVDRRGKFVGGSCGGYSPDYYAPLHRYRACINHPDWAEWHRGLIRLVAEVGYDGCFVDNTHPDPCFCRHCRRRFAEFLEANAGVPWVERLTQGLAARELTLGSERVPAELVRRWRLLRTRDHLGMLREVGRQVRPGFTLFPNSGRMDDCLLVGAKCDRLMFESTFSPGILAEGEPPETGDILIRVGSFVPTHGPPLTHRYELHDPTTWMEMTADVTVPSRVGPLRSYPFRVKLLSVGASLRDGDAAEDFHLLLQGVETGRTVRVPLEPAGPVGGTSSSRKPRQPPLTLKGAWTVRELPEEEEAFAVYLAFRYTDDSHPETRLRARRDKLTRGQVCRSHLAELLFTQHMAARTIYLGYEARKRDTVQELALAEMAAFSGGGGFSGTGSPQAKYRAFFKKHPELLAGWTPTAPAAVLYARWGPNALHAQRPPSRRRIEDHLATTHRLFVAWVDHTLTEEVSELGRVAVLYLPSPSYEMSGAQLAALQDFARGTRRVVLGHARVRINGEPARRVLGPAGGDGAGEAVPVWSWERLDAARTEAERSRVLAELLPTAPVAPSEGRRRNLRLALYRQGARLTLHAVNYNVCLLDKDAPVLPVPPTPLRLPVPAGWTAAQATCYSPEAKPAAVACSVMDAQARLTLPRTRIYQVVLLERAASE